MNRFIRLKLELDKDEWFALRDRALQDYREPASQARYILRGALFGESTPSADQTATNTLLQTGIAPEQI